MSPATRKIRDAANADNPLARMLEEIAGRYLVDCNRQCLVCAAFVGHGRGCPGRAIKNVSECYEPFSSIIRQQRIG